MKAQRHIDEILRLPDFAWGPTDGVLVSSKSWNVWAALGAWKPKGFVAKRQLFVQARVLTIYECAIQAIEKHPRLKVNTDPFDEALHHEVSRADPDITKHVDASELGRALKMYSAAFYNREDHGDIEREKTQGGSTRFQLRQAAAEWEAVLREQRRQKKKGKAKGGDKEGKSKEETKGGVKEQDKNDLQGEEETTQEHAMLMGRLAVSEFLPARLENETDAAYNLRLQDKVRELRTRVRSMRGIIEDKDKSIRKLKVKVEELREMEEDDDDSDDDPGSDPASSSP